MAHDRKDRTRQVWLETLEQFRRDPHRPGSGDYWSPSLDCAGRDELQAIQSAKIEALTPFLYENSPFYRRRFDQLGLAPTDIRSVEDLSAWPVVDKQEMMQDALEHPPWGTYTAMDDDLWRRRGWMMFSSSGSTGAPRVFRYSQVDRELWSWANARAIHSFGIRPHDSMLICAGYGPHVFAWGIQYAAALMNVPVIPGGGMNSDMRAMLVERYRPTVIVSTPSYALYLGRVLEEQGLDPARSSVSHILVGGEPAAGIASTRERLEALWSARVVEFYGCTEVSPHCGGYSCPASDVGGGPVTSHLMEDVQVWEVVDAESREALPAGQRGLTVCTSLNSETSPQLRFLVGDYTVLDPEPCPCGRTHVRAVGAFAGRADDLINLRGLKMYPTEIEQAVRTVAGIGDEYEIVLATNDRGLDVMRLRVEHKAGESVAARVRHAVRSHCEVQAEVEVLPPGTLPKTEFKAKRVRDERAVRGG